MPSPNDRQRKANDVSDMEHCSLEMVVGRLESLLGRPDTADDFVRFRIALLRAQVEAREAASHLAPLGEGGEQVGEQIVAPIDFAAIPMPSENLLSLFKAILSAVQQHGSPSEEFEVVGKAVEEDPSLLEVIARKAAVDSHREYFDGLSQRLGVSVDVLLFIGRMVVAPFVAAVAGKMDVCSQDEADDSPSDARICPICSSAPGLASLTGEEGRRLLHCSLCGHAWAFARIACSRCGSTDQQVLGKLLIPDEEAKWLEVCDTCHGYVKTVDCRKLSAGEAWMAVVEDVATLPLDLLAEKEGHSRNPPYAALI